MCLRFVQTQAFALLICTAAAGCSGTVTEGSSSNSDDEGMSSKPGDGKDGDGSGGQDPGDGSESPAEDPFEDVPEVAVGDEFTCDEDKAHAAPGSARRLTVSELGNTVSDLLGVDIRNQLQEIPDAQPTVREFNNRSLGVSRQHLNVFENLAESIASKADLSDLVGTHAPECTQDSQDSKECREKFISGVGKLLFRSPVLDAERAALMKVFDAGNEHALKFESSARFVLQTMLQSPRFLYRIENEVDDGEEKALSSYAMASRLSYALWHSAPDSELMEAAQADELSSEAQIAEQARRMLKDPRASEAIVTFLDDWMDLHRASGGQTIKDKFEDFDPALMEDMRDETRALFEYVVKENLPVTRLFNLQKTFGSRRLAEHYGLPNPRDGFSEYNLSDVPERGGLLTQGIMASLGGADSSPVRAGLHILHEVLCGTMQDPPPGLDIEPVPPKPGLSVRATSEERVDDAVCGSCHKQFEPLIWGMLRFRPTGEYANDDPYGNALSEDGWIIFPDAPEKQHSYDDVAGMMDILGESSRVRDCLLLKTASYMSARTLRESDACSLKSARDKLDANATFTELVEAVVTSPNFRRVLTESR